MENEKKYASLFGNNPDISQAEKDRVFAEIQKIGGLTFSIETDEEGWTARCNEMSGIIAGNTNPDPSNAELETQIREAIYAAFNVKYENRSPVKFEYTLQVA